MGPSPGVFIQFACDPNQMVGKSSGEERNSLFTKHLLRHITEKGLNLAELFQRIEDDVYQASNQKQKPISIDGLDKKQQIYLIEPVKGKLDEECAHCKRYLR
jgi:uncharacterized caspase-like protein